MPQVILVLKVWKRLWSYKRDQNIEIWRRLGQVIKKIFPCRQSWAKFLKKGKEIKQN